MVKNSINKERWDLAQQEEKLHHTHDSTDIALDRWKDIYDFYHCIICLKNVTDTDDIDYYKYMSVFKNYINL